MTATRTPTWTLGEHLAKARKDAEISVQQMADRLGVSRNTITNYEADRVHVSRSVVMAYASTCDVPLSWLDAGVTQRSAADEAPGGRELVAA